MKLRFKKVAVLTKTKIQITWNENYKTQIKPINFFFTERFVVLSAKIAFEVNSRELERTDNSIVLKFFFIFYTEKIKN